jgi:acyl phosphate:glycerol-3-phosphate acyltransferase
VAVLLAALAGYLAGSIPSGYWVVRLGRGVDIRTVGSGNIGASNVWRTFGRRYGLPVALLDVGKGFAPALTATLTAGHLAGAVAGAAAMVGHWRPIFLGFRRGGKMVATCGGAFLGVAPVVGLLGAAVWIVVFGLFRYASLASILASLSLPAVAVALGEPWPVVGFASAAALAVVVLHRANIGRLLHRTERRFEFRRRHSEVAARP